MHSRAWVCQYVNLTRVLKAVAFFTFSFDFGSRWITRCCQILSILAYVVYLSTFALIAPFLCYLWCDGQVFSFGLRRQVLGLVFAYVTLVLVLANLFDFKSGVKFGLIWSTVVNLPLRMQWFPMVIKPGLLFHESIAMMPNHLATAAWLKKIFFSFWFKC